MRFGFKITGAKELQRRLRKLPRVVQRKLMREALRAAAAPVLAEAQRLVPVDTGQLRSSLVIRAAKTKRRGSIGVQVQTRDGAFKGDEYYGAFVELGTHKHHAHPFLRPALDNTREQAVAIARRVLASGIEAEASS